jgi:hypothetical protein
LQHFKRFAWLSRLEQLRRLFDLLLHFSLVLRTDAYPGSSLFVNHMYQEFGDVC